MHLDHPRLLVTRFADCFRFYRDVMDFKATWGDEDNSYASFADPEGQTTALALFKRGAMAEAVGTADLPSDAPCQDRIMLIFAVEDVDDAVAALRKRGVQFAAGPRDFPDWGIRSAYLRDPDGNLIELCSGLDPAQWSEALHESTHKYTGT